MLKLEDNYAEFLKDIQGDMDTCKRNFKQQVFRAFTVLEAEILAQIRGKSGLHVRTGTLLNSIGRSKSVTENANGEIVGTIGPEGVEYAKIHEFGGPIVPKNKQFLAIPIGTNRRADGLPRQTTGDLRNTGNSFVRDGLIFLQEGKRITPMFALKRSVTMPARPYLATALKAKREEIVKNFGIFFTATYDFGGE